ncbi:MAG: hypothetical protein IPP12_22495 [Nitrospira sp.]|nr:hypothetical protein [Nitrospira sp.]
MSSCRATNAKGRRALARCQLVTLRAVVPVAGSSLPVVERVVALWERELADDEPTSDEWAARSAEASAEASAAWAALAALASAEAALASAALASAAWAARAAAESAEAAQAAAAWAARAAAWTAKAETWTEAWAVEAARADTIIFGHLAAIREELGT